MSKTRASGFTLIELVVSASIFLMVFGTGVWAVSRGVHLYAESTIRQGLQRDIQTIAALLREDGSKTNFFRTQNLSGSAVGGESRDALAMVAMNSWQGDLPLDDLGLPAWNNVVAYLSTQEEPGHFVRAVVRPDTVPVQSPQLAPILQGLLAHALPAGDLLLSEKLLSQSVSEFEVTPLTTLGLLQCQLKLADDVVQPDGLGSRREVLEVQVLLHPQNTWPSIQ